MGSKSEKRKSELQDANKKKKKITTQTYKKKTKKKKKKVVGSKYKIQIGWISKYLQS